MSKAEIDELKDWLWNFWTRQYFSGKAYIPNVVSVAISNIWQWEMGEKCI